MASGKRGDTKFPFTVKKLENIRPASKAIDYRDAGCPGLTLRVSVAGKKTFRWTFKDHLGKFRVKTLGEFPAMGLEAARSKLSEAKEHRKHSVITVGHETRPIKLVSDLAVEFLEHLKTQRKRPDEAQAIFDNDIIPLLGKLSLDPPPRSHVIGNAMKAIVRRGAPVHAGKVLNLTKQMFRYGVGSGYMTSNPAEPLDPGQLGIQAYTPGERSLTTEEIRTFWQLLDGTTGLGQHTELGLKLLLVTGVRTQELLRARKGDFDLKAGRWTIPVENQKLTLKRAKTAKPFVIPLPRMAVELAAALIALDPDSPWVMASRSSASGHYNDKALGKALRRLFARKVIDDVSGQELPYIDMPPFTPHDLRRTMKTHMGRLGVDPHISERCLNHSLGRITDTYDTGDYLEQRSQAMERWADFLDLTVNERENVIRLEA